MIYVDIFPPPKKKKKKPKKNKSKRLRDTCTSCTAYHLSWRYHFHEVLCVWRQWYYSDLIKLSLFFEYFSYLLLDFLCFGFSSKNEKKYTKCISNYMIIVIINMLIIICIRISSSIIIRTISSLCIP